MADASGPLNISDETRSYVFPSLWSSSVSDIAAAFGMYIRQLEECCQLLFRNPALGRQCDEIRPGLRRMRQGKHVVFYRQEPGGILISRIGVTPPFVKNCTLSVGY